jgi:pimeloyl-ACP methyl ester carboxylesterase
MHLGCAFPSRIIGLAGAAGLLQTSPVIPGIKYADSGDLQIAYQVVGDGPVDVVFAFDWAGNIELAWENPQTERFLRRFASYGRLIFFDMRGVGLSDPVEGLPPLEEWMDDVRTVMDAVGSERAALVGHGHAGQLCMLVAASHPDRVQALVTVNSFARLARAPEYRVGMPEGAQQTWIEGIRATWGTTDPLHLLVLAPDLAGDEFARAWWARIERAAGSPRRAVRKQELAFQLDVRDVLEAISVPTMVIQSAGNLFVMPTQGRYLAKHIPGARYLELASGGHWPWAAPDADRFLDELEVFLTGTPHAPGRDRVLATVAFTDIVDSTATAASMGDRRWRELLQIHDSIARREVQAARGHTVKSTGDGLLATFDGPARAIRCVGAIERGVATLGLHVRAGLHTGEIELFGDDVGGIAVAIAARLTSLAGSDEVVVSSTVKDLVVGSGIRFEDRGIHALKGVPEEWHVFAVQPA